MARDSKGKMMEVFAPYIDDHEVFEYYLLGEIAPSTKESWIVAGVVLVVLMVAGYFLNINLFYMIIAAMAMVFIILNVVIKNVYMAKVGKRLYVCESDLFHLSEKVEIVPLKNIVYHKEAGFDKETFLEINIEGNVRRVTLKNKPKYFTNQKETIDRLVDDVKKKQK